MKRAALFLALAFAAGVALAHNCPNEWKAIDAALPAAKLDAAKIEDLGRAKRLVVDKGEFPRDVGEVPIENQGERASRRKGLQRRFRQVRCEQTAHSPVRERPAVNLSLCEQVGHATGHPRPVEWLAQRMLLLAVAANHSIEPAIACHEPQFEAMHIEWGQCRRLHVRRYSGDGQLARARRARRRGSRRFKRARRDSRRRLSRSRRFNGRCCGFIHFASFFLAPRMPSTQLKSSSSFDSSAR